MSGPVVEPVAWGRGLSSWTRIALWWLMAVTVTGAAVRLTGSGLGCTDWPTCSANTELDAPAFHSTIEFGNRVISGLAILPVFAAWIAARGRRPDLRPWLVAMVVGFAGQVLLGMLVTRTELDPRVVLGHFLLSIVLVFIGVVLDEKARRPGIRSLHDWHARHGWVLVAATSLVIMVGTLVTGSGPHTGSDESGEAIPRLGFDIREITRVHSSLVWVLAAAVLFGLWRAQHDPATRRRLVAIAGLGAAQGAVGYLQYALGVPVLLVGVHIAGAVLLWTVVVTHALRSAELPLGSAVAEEVLA